MSTLEDVTFIVPVRIESQDRFRNLFLSMLYLLSVTNANIIIKESDSCQIVPEVIDKLKKFGTDTNRIKYLFENAKSDMFHRTRLLNEMLFETRTPVVVNYDCDVLLPKSSYEKASEMCRNEYDLVYPYKFGEDAQKRVLIEDQSDIQEFIFNDFDLSKFKTFFWRAEYGFCQFFKTESYFKGYMENENFLAYGPEDVERAKRWEKLGFKVGRVEDVVYHLEHSRTQNSNPTNPFMKSNENLFDMLKSMSKDELIKYYESQEYCKKYQK